MLSEQTHTISTPAAPSTPQARQSGRRAYVLKMYPRFSETFIVSEILAREAAGEDLVIFSLRPSTDTRFHPELARVRAEILAALGTPWTVRRMAAAALVSERTFARRFTATTGTTPLRWLLDQRILTVQRLLEETDLPVDTVATRCGFASAVSLRPVFVKRVGVAPREYRRTFRGREEG